MTKVTAGITMSVDGYIAGPDDGPGTGLGVGGERLHYWVFGGPWTYDAPPEGGAAGEDQAWLESVMAGLGAVVTGRWTYEAADRWGGTNPAGVPCFVVTHRPDEQPDGAGFTFVDGVEKAVALAKEAAGAGHVNVMGGADVIRQALDAGLVDELTIIVAPVVLGAGKRLFDGFTRSVQLQHLGVRQSSHATFIDYRVLPA
ncbi:dihydrofolate reductase family protein [Pseudonocardia alaniniphila]|uniref:Dihydrofolate reductase family protein n=1 Tax=Pseudonocardia alaniniphila TaxID=75291 RepID=A0ABS9TDV9_9PSEU|nr:dihydrofolate reductase family protein [Pseudonocardia alaniniphila]MCH6166724.1 dihydrofolate reductase family protein [Pseudonocardia alaniniphila]